jgi:PBSX family phage terminase large subunit
MTADYLKLQGAMVQIWKCRDQEILAEGPAGTAKTRTILEALDFTARKYANARILIVRKTRTSMTHSVMATYKRFVQKADVHFHTTNQEYQFRNGSIMAVAGMDNPAKILSSEWDLVYWNEATEGTEDEWEILSTRLRGGVVPYQQMIADCNPDVENHWLNQRAATVKMTRIVTRHEDNPLYWDATKGEYTPEGERYVTGVLDKLSGVRLLRYRKGIWASREGLVYDGFDRTIHVLRGEQMTGRAIVSVDWGYTNPGVMQVWVIDGDERMYLVRELYQTGKTIEWWIGRAKEIQDRFHPERFICDPSEPAYIAQFKDAGLPAKGANNDIRLGIDAVTERLKVQGDGKPRLFLMEDALVEIDLTLRDKGLPACTLEEFGSYAWPKAKPDRNDKEVPIDAYNHGQDATRYATLYLDGRQVHNNIPASGGRRTFR